MYLGKLLFWHYRLYPTHMGLHEGVFRLLLLSSEEVFRRLHQDEHIRLSHTSSEDVFKMSWTNPTFVLVIRFQDVFKTSSRRAKMSFRHPQKVLLRRLQDIFKTSSRGLTKASLRHLQDVLQRCLQDFFNTYHQVKLFLLTCFQDVFETYSKHSWHLLERRLSTEGFF